MTPLGSLCYPFGSFLVHSFFKGGRMHSTVQPALEHYLGIPGFFITLLILVGGLALFSYIIYKRYLLLRPAKPDLRLDSLWWRFYDLIIYGILQKRQPRYLWVGILHILIFWGFVALALRTMTLYGLGLKAEFVLPFMGGPVGEFYHLLKDVFEIIVLFACVAAILRRAISRPARYEFKHGKVHKFHAYLVLGLISFHIHLLIIKNAFIPICSAIRY